jgi:hypothetical protein
MACFFKNEAHVRPSHDWLYSNAWGLYSTTDDYPGYGAAIRVIAPPQKLAVYWQCFSGFPVFFKLVPINYVSDLPSF